MTLIIFIDIILKISKTCKDDKLFSYLNFNFFVMEHN